MVVESAAVLGISSSEPACSMISGMMVAAAGAGGWFTTAIPVPGAQQVAVNPTEAGEMMADVVKSLRS